MITNMIMFSLSMIEPGKPFWGAGAGGVNNFVFTEHSYKTYIKTL